MQRLFHWLSFYISMILWIGVKKKKQVEKTLGKPGSLQPVKIPDVSYASCGYLHMLGGCDLPQSFI